MDGRYLLIAPSLSPLQPVCGNPGVDNAMMISSKLAVIIRTNGKVMSMESPQALPRDEKEPVITETVRPAKAGIRIRKLDKIETTGEIMTGNSNS